MDRLSNWVDTRRNIFLLYVGALPRPFLESVFFSFYLFLFFSFSVFLWWRNADKLMTSWWRADDELMTSWWRADNKLMTNWWQTDAKPHYRTLKPISGWMGWMGWMGWLSLEGAIYRAPTVLINAQMRASTSTVVLKVRTAVSHVKTVVIAVARRVVWVHYDRVEVRLRHPALWIFALAALLCLPAAPHQADHRLRHDHQEQTTDGRLRIHLSFILLLRRVCYAMLCTIRV